MEDYATVLLPNRVRAAARRAFDERFDIVTGQLDEPFAAAVEAVVELCGRARDENESEDEYPDEDKLFVARECAETVIVPALYPPGDKFRLPERDEWPADELVRELLDYRCFPPVPPPLAAFVDDPDGPVQISGIGGGPGSGYWRAVSSFVHKDVVYFTWYVGLDEPYFGYHAAYRITDPTEVANEWYEKACAYVYDEGDDPEWPEQWWDLPC